MQTNLFDGQLAKCATIFIFHFFVIRGLCFSYLSKTYKNQILFKRGLLLHLPRLHFYWKFIHPIEKSEKLEEIFKNVALL